MSSITKPIFMIGVPRSGTTIIFEALSNHEDLGYFTSFTSRFPNFWFMEGGVRIFNLPIFKRLPKGEKKQYKQGKGFIHRFLPTPIENYEKWVSLCGEKFAFDYLLDTTATVEEEQKVKTTIKRLLSVQGKPRFLGKFTGPPRMAYLKSIFPDAIFVNVIRDPRAVVNSLLEVDFWKAGNGYTKPWWKNGLLDGWEAEWEKYGRSPAALTAIQIRRINEVTNLERKDLKEGQFLEVTYEDFIANPVSVMDKILTHCQLRSSMKLTEYITTPGRYQNMNDKYKEDLSVDDIRAVEEIAGKYGT